MTAPKPKPVKWQAWVFFAGFLLTTVVGIAAGMAGVLLGIGWTVPLVVVMVAGSVITTFVMWRDDLRAAQAAKKEAREQR